jgi:5-formyltetrahydrofolate cyclo-ligase
MTSVDSARSSVLQKAKSLSREEMIAGSKVVVSRWCEQFLLQKNTSTQLQGMPIALYRALPGELDLHPLEEFLKSQGARLSYPRVLDNGDLEFMEVPDPHSLDHWKTGPYGISEPHPELQKTDPKSFQILIIPGVAFGRSGERVGRGKGYYDRFLPQTAPGSGAENELGPLRVALAFDFQLFPSLEQKHWDQPVHWIMTEQQDIRLPAAERWLERLIRS